MCLEGREGSLVFFFFLLSSFFFMITMSSMYRVFFCCLVLVHLPCKCILVIIYPINLGFIIISLYPFFSLFHFLFSFDSSYLLSNCLFVLYNFFTLFLWRISIRLFAYFFWNIKLRTKSLSIISCGLNYCFIIKCGLDYCFYDQMGFKLMFYCIFWCVAW